MNLSMFIRLWGGIDVAFILWRVFKDVSESKIPFFSSFAEALHADVTFGLTSMTIMTTAGIIVTISIAVSGPLMLALNRIGVYISLVQFPFRLTLLISPTFFFIQSARGFLPSALLIAIMLIFEIIKAATEIRWLKSRGRRLKE